MNLKTLFTASVMLADATKPKPTHPPLISTWISLKSGMQQTFELDRAATCKVVAHCPAPGSYQDLLTESQGSCPDYSTLFFDKDRNEVTLQLAPQDAEATLQLYVDESTKPGHPATVVFSQEQTLTIMCTPTKKHDANDHPVVAGR